jgi:hypothetical protein
MRVARRMIVVRVFVAVLALIGVVACGPRVVQCEPLTGAPVTAVSGGQVQLGTRAYQVEALVARDVSPTLVPSFAKGIGVHVRLVAVDGQPFPEVQPACVRVERGVEVWETRLADAPSGRGRDQSGRATLDATAGEGPAWEPDTTVRLTAWLRVDGKVVGITFGERVVERAS